MTLTNSKIVRLYWSTALLMLLSALALGVLASQTYLIPDFFKSIKGLTTLRPLHVSAIIFWILLGATGCLYGCLYSLSKTQFSNKIALAQWLLWIIAIIGIFVSYIKGNFGGREYWEFPPQWSLFIAAAWVLFIINFIKVVRKIKNWPVYIWMWITGITFFLFTFIENYLWLFPYFREHFVTDMTIQWKVNGSLVGCWNLMLYGTAFYLMDKIKNVKETGSSKLAFAMYFLGLFNLMFNWGHHIYTLPTEEYIRYIGYAVSMTEWVFFIKIIYNWKQSVTESQIHFHYFPYRFILAADLWVFINLGQALMMSIPAINIYTHGTHVTVAHAMGTTIGINTMILFAACFEFAEQKILLRPNTKKILNVSFWLIQVSLFVFLICLDVAGIKKAIWQREVIQVPFSEMMKTLYPWFAGFAYTGVVLLISLAIPVFILIRSFATKNKM